MQTPLGTKARRVENVELNVAVTRNPGALANRVSSTPSEDWGKEKGGEGSGREGKGRKEEPYF